MRHAYFHENRRTTEKWISQISGVSRLRAQSLASLTYATTSERKRRDGVRVRERATRGTRTFNIKYQTFRVFSILKLIRADAEMERGKIRWRAYLAGLPCRALDLRHAIAAGALIFSAVVRRVMLILRFSSDFCAEVIVSDARVACERNIRSWKDARTSAARAWLEKRDERGRAAAYLSYYQEKKAYSLACIYSRIYSRPCGSA